MSLFNSKKYESEPPVSVLPTFTYTEPPVSVVPTFRFDHLDYHPYRIPLWSILVIVGVVAAVIFSVAISVFTQCRQRQRLTSQPPPSVVLPPIPMIEVQNNLPAQA
ncbi:hypothetical protein QL285_029909 [Trifolium repens]|nr:hypothetical protein QL285_029909 [Trifolium repens]